MKTNLINIPSVLAYKSKMDFSDGLMYACCWEERESKRQVLSVTEKTVRGTISNRLKDKAKTKSDADASVANIQTVDVAMLPSNADTLAVTFTLKVLGDVEKTYACNDPVFQKQAEAKIREFIDRTKLKTLSLRYAANILGSVTFSVFQSSIR